MIKTIIFDLAETLIQGARGVDEHLEEILHQKVNLDQLYIDELELLFFGKITENAYWKAVVRKHKWDVSLKQLKNVVRNNFKEITGTRKIIEELKQQGYKLGLLSIHAKEWVEYMDKIYDYHKLFDAISYSCTDNISKPDRKAYEGLLIKLKAKPSESLFIDDNPNFVTAAENVGIKGIVFKNPQQLRNALIKLNIKLQN